MNGLISVFYLICLNHNIYFVLSKFVYKAVPQKMCMFVLVYNLKSKSFLYTEYPICVMFNMFKSKHLFLFFFKLKIISHVSIIYTFKSISISVHSTYMCFVLLWLNHIIVSVLCFRNICLLLLIFVMYPYSCYACSILYICKYCVCSHGPYGLLDVGIKVYIM